MGSPVVMRYDMIRNQRSGAGAKNKFWQMGIVSAIGVIEFANCHEQSTVLADGKQTSQFAQFAVGFFEMLSAQLRT